MYVHLCRYAYVLHHNHAHTYTHSFSLSLSRSLSRSLPHTHTQMHTQAHTHIHTVSLTHQINHFDNSRQMTLLADSINSSRTQHTCDEFSAYVKYYMRNLCHTYAQVMPHIWKSPAINTAGRSTHGTSLPPMSPIICGIHATRMRK